MASKYSIRRGTVELDSPGIPPPINPEPAVTAGDAVTEAEIKGYGVSVRIPLPKWAITTLAGVLIVGLMAAGATFTYTYVMHQVTVSRATLSEYEEAYKHSLEPAEAKQETPVAFPDGTTVTVHHYKSDGCNQIVRMVPALQKADGLWMFGPVLKPESKVADAIRVRPGIEDLRATSVAMSRGAISFAGFVPAWGSERSANSSAEAQGQCLNPHPGHSRQKDQKVGQCSVQVWRYFDDGCVHYQFFNPCAGTWDVWPDGRPRVHWEKCVH
jgi:hypothetical protein